jgi:hypothetical protein
MNQRQASNITVERVAPDLDLAPHRWLIAFPVIVSRSFSSAC